jgi:hypothetical protein
MQKAEVVLAMLKKQKSSKTAEEPDTSKGVSRV